MKVLLCVTGSVAAKLTPKLLEALEKEKIEVKIALTQHALYFWNSPSENCFQDSDEWARKSYQENDPVLHIELRKWADLLLIAPLTANTLAKIACGMADNLVTSVVRAWDREKPILLAPAMNTLMWDNEFTKEHLAKIQRLFSWTEIISPVEKLLACGDKGMGAMAPIETIVSKVKRIKIGVFKDEEFCPFCGILVSQKGYCTIEDRKLITDGTKPCSILMQPDENGKHACWCNSFRQRQFKHTHKMSNKELDSIVENCPDCQGSGRRTNETCKG